MPRGILRRVFLQDKEEHIVEGKHIQPCRLALVHPILTLQRLHLSNPEIHSQIHLQPRNILTHDEPIIPFLDLPSNTPKSFLAVKGELHHVKTDLVAFLQFTSK